MSTAEPMGVVLLCAEDDDLELVSWVHIARKHGITPEVVTGVERDDEPLIEALAMTGSALFILLRSENLPLPRCKQLKAVFARHHHPGQDMLALRLQPEEAETAFEKIAVRLGRKVRPRTGSMPAIPIDRHPTPRPALPDESSPMHTGPDPTDTFVPLRDSAVTTMPVAVEAVAPPVATALDWARRATELEVTEPQLRIDPAPLEAETSTSNGAKVRPAGVVALATITALVMVAAVVGGALWIGQSPDTATDLAVPAPIDAREPELEQPLPGPTARIPTVEPAAHESRSKPRPRKRASPTSDDAREESPLAEIVPPPPPADPEPAPPVADGKPLEPQPHAEAAPPSPPVATTPTAATAEPTPAKPVEPPA